jgi:hypothetical protein
MGVERKLCVAAGKAGRMGGDVELAVRADQIPHLSCRQRGGIVAERQPVGRRFGPDPRAQVGEGLRKPGQILGAGFWVKSMSLVAGIGACWAMAAKAPMIT